MCIFSDFIFSVENRKKYFFSAEKTEKPKKSLKPKKPKILRGNPKKIAWKTEKIAQKTEKIVENTEKCGGGIRIDFIVFNKDTTTRFITAYSLLKTSHLLTFRTPHFCLMETFFKCNQSLSYRSSTVYSIIQLICVALVCSSQKCIQSCYQKDW